MSDCLITSKGATRAQQMAAMLAKNGLPARVVRPPSEITEEGCGFAVAVAGQLLPRALDTLRSGNLSPRRVYCMGRSGRYTEAGGMR